LKGKIPVAVQFRAAALATYSFAVLALLLLPVGVVVLASFTRTSYLTIPPKGLTFRWYVEVLGSPSYVRSIVLSLGLALTATAVAILVAVPAAYALARFRVAAANLLVALFLAPLAFPGIVVGVALLQLYSMMNIQPSIGRLLVAHLIITTPFVIRAVLATLRESSVDLEDAARVLGASRWVAFRRVTLPLIRPAIVVGALFAFIASFDNFPVSVFILGARQITLPVKIFSSIEYGVDPSIAAVSTMVIVATGLILVAAERWTGLHRAF